MFVNCTFLCVLLRFKQFETVIIILEDHMSALNYYVGFTCNFYFVLECKIETINNILS